MNAISYLKEKLVSLKNKNPWLLFFWNESLRKRGNKELREYTDIASVNRLYYRKAGRFPDLHHPRLFSEKMQWLKLYYRNQEMEVAADKYGVREYLEKKGYGYLLNDVITVYERMEDFDLDALPEKFVLKASHGSGWNLVVTAKAEVNWFVYRKIMQSWLQHNIFWNGREWHYKHIKPRIICEKYLEDTSGQLMDYKIFCFNGTPSFIQANKGRGTKRHAQNFYDQDWKILPFGKDLAPLPEVDIPRPYTLAEMIRLATELSAPFPFVRVDFYEVKRRIIFGELTFFPASGLPDFVPSEYDRIVGNMLQLPDKNI